MGFITWNETLSVGVTRFDVEHKKLISIINDLDDAMKSGKGKDVIRDTLVGLLDYTKLHFANEEKMMQRYNYPSYEEHKTEHDKLKSEVVKFIKEFNSGKTALSIQIMTFLKDWLINHIQGSDKKYKTFFNENGLV